MSKTFLEHIEGIEDPRIPEMVLYPLDEILLSILEGCNRPIFTVMIGS